MNLNLRGQKILITGSSRGIGFGIAKELVDEDARVIITGRNLAELEKAQSQLGANCEIFCGDLTKTQDLNRLVEKYPTIQHLVCNLGSGQSVPIGSETVEEWHRVFEINFYSVVKTIDVYKKQLINVKGTIICISSICGHEALGAPVAYSVAKSALNSYVNNMSRFFGDHGVRLNAISPGNIFFEGSSWERKLKENPDRVQSMLQTEVPLHRFGEPQDIGALVAFLVSEKARFINGSTLVVDGGQLRV